MVRFGNLPRAERKKLLYTVVMGMVAGTVLGAVAFCAIYGYMEVNSPVRLAASPHR
jgi:hypothetical protein